MSKIEIAVVFSIATLASISVGWYVWCYPPTNTESFTGLLFDFLLVAILICGIESVALLSRWGKAAYRDRQFARFAFPISMSFAMLGLVSCVILQAYELSDESKNILLGFSAFAAILIAIFALAILIETIRRVTQSDETKRVVVHTTVLNLMLQTFPNPTRRTLVPEKKRYKKKPTRQQK